MDKENKMRILYMAKILYEQTDKDHTISGPDIIQTLKQDYDISSHRQTVVDDIALLKGFGMDIETIRSNPNYYHVVSRSFDDTDIKMLTDAVCSAKFIPAGKTEEITEKLSCLTSRHSEDLLQRNIDAEGRVKTDNDKTSGIIDAVSEAINEEKKISFYYFGHNKKKAKKLTNNGKPYVFSPYRIIWNGDFYYMVGQSDKHERVITFRIDRISDMPEILSERAHNSGRGYGLSAYLNSSFDMSSCEEVKKVTLLCESDAMDEFAGRFGSRSHVKHLENGGFEAVVSVPTGPEFYGWVFGFAGKIKITAPEDVRNGYIKLLERGLENTEPDFDVPSQNP